MKEWVFVMSDAINEDEPKENQSLENIRPLKTLVVSMGLIMVGGTILLAMLVWKKVDAQTKGTGAYACDGGKADLKGKGAVIRMERDGKQLFVTLQGGQNLEVATVDLCNGKVKSSLILDVDSNKIK